MGFSSSILSGGGFSPEQMTPLLAVGIIGSTSYGGGSSTDIITISGKGVLYSIDLFIGNVTNTVFGFAIVIDGTEYLLYSADGTIPRRCWELGNYGYATSSNGQYQSTRLSGIIPFRQSLKIRLKNIAGGAFSTSLAYTYKGGLV